MSGTPATHVIIRFFTVESARAARSQRFGRFAVHRGALPPVAPAVTVALPRLQNFIDTVNEATYIG